ALGLARGHPGAEIGAAQIRQGLQARRLAVMFIEKPEQLSGIPCVGFGGQIGDAAFVAQPGEPLAEGILQIRRGAKTRAIVGRIAGYGLGRSSHERMPNSMMRPRKLSSSVPCPGWK